MLAFVIQFTYQRERKVRMGRIFHARSEPARLSDEGKKVPMRPSERVRLKIIIG